MAVVKSLIKRFEVYLIALDLTKGSEIKKSRPCVVISPNEMNVLRTVLVAPMTSQGFLFPSRISLKFQGKAGFVVLDQIRAVDKSRLIKKLGLVSKDTQNKILGNLQEIFSP